MWRVRRRVAGCAAAVGAVLVAACGLLGGGRAEPPVEEMLQRAAAAVERVTSVHFQLEISGGHMIVGPGLPVTKVEGDLAQPDRVRLKAAGQAGTSTLEMEFVAIGERQYVADPFTRQWQALPTSPIAFTPLDARTGMPAVIRSLEGAQRVGRVQVGGVDSYHVRGSVDAQRLAGLTGTAPPAGAIATDLWIGVADFLPRQIRVAGPLAAGEAPGIVRLIQLTHYNRPITIEPPA